MPLDTKLENKVYKEKVEDKKVEKRDSDVLKVKETNRKVVGEEKENGETMNSKLYKVQEQIKPKGLEGISEAQIEDHWKLYEAYVAQVNALDAELKKMRDDGLMDSPLYADRRRRYGFEFNGMVLHEYYFSTLTADAEKRKKPAKDSVLYRAIVSSWGSFDNWQRDFENAGKTRGIGWAILYADTETKRLFNHFIAEHEDGHIAGWAPILVMDVWEHAYMIDYKAGGRGKYIKAFTDNINWRKVEERYQAVFDGKIPSRISL